MIQQVSVCVPLCTPSASLEMDWAVQSLSPFLKDFSVVCFSGRFIKVTEMKQNIPWQEGAKSPGEPLACHFAILLAATNTRDAFRVQVIPADAQLSDPSGNPWGRRWWSQLGRNSALNPSSLMQAPESHWPLMRLVFSCDKGQHAWLGKTGGNTGRILQSWTSALPITFYTSTHHFLILKDPLGNPKDATVFLKPFWYNWTWSAYVEAKAQADKHRTDPSMLGKYSFPAEIWLGRRKSLCKDTETG